MTNCPKCYFKKWLKTGKYDSEGLQIFKCGRCGKEQSADRPFIRQNQKILYFDIENSLTDIYGNFGLTVKGERLSHEMIRNPYFIICWSAQWVGSSKILSACVTQEEAIKRDDSNILAPLWDLMNEADVLAGHNIKYDIKSANTRFIYHAYEKPEPPHSIYDTLLISRRNHRLESNTLDYLCKFLGIKGKNPMERQDWVDIQETGDPKKLKKMLTYNRADVRNGVKALEILKGWSPPPPNFGMRSIAKEPPYRKAKT